MTQTDFNLLFIQQVNRCEETLRGKAKEQAAQDDRPENGYPVSMPSHAPTLFLASSVM